MIRLPQGFEWAQSPVLGMPEPGIMCPRCKVRFCVVTFGDLEAEQAAYDKWAKEHQC